MAKLKRGCVQVRNSPWSPSTGSALLPLPAAKQAFEVFAPGADKPSHLQ